MGPVKDMEVRIELLSWACEEADEAEIEYFFDKPIIQGGT